MVGRKGGLVRNGRELPGPRLTVRAWARGSAGRRQAQSWRDSGRVAKPPQAAGSMAWDPRLLSVCLSASGLVQAAW